MCQRLSNLSGKPQNCNYSRRNRENRKYESLRSAGCCSADKCLLLLLCRRRRRYCSVPVHPPRGGVSGLAKMVVLNPHRGATAKSGHDPPTTPVGRGVVDNHLAPSLYPPPTDGSMWSGTPQRVFVSNRSINPAPAHISSSRVKPVLTKDLLGAKASRLGAAAPDPCNHGSPVTVFHRAPP